MIGEKLAQYEILEKLGEGGMGVVYRASDRRLQREVALKVLRDEMAGRREQRDHVLAEARAVSPLNHPSVATIYEVGEHEGRLFIVMELVHGETLRRRMKGRKFRTREIARLGTQICEPLETAHGQKIVHGDVKPENIILQPDGRIKLLDFGVAKRSIREAVTETLTETATPVPNRDYLAGTLAYMAPERLGGEWDDSRSDLFSVGVILFELALGHQPFPGPDPAAYASQILHQSAPRIDLQSAGHPGELLRIIHKLLEKDPDARYQSARDLQVDLVNLERDLELGPTLSSSVVGRRSLAVLPFRLLAPNPEDEYLSVALADALINGLSRSTQLLLRPSSSVMRYAHTHVDPLVAARELNVQVIVEGSLQKFGPQMRAHVQVWNAEDGTTILSVKHDAEMSELFALQDRMSESLYSALGMTPDVPDSPLTSNPRAYELFLRAVERLTQVNRWDVRTAIDMLRTVTSLDPNFADAWARLAQGCIMMAWAFEPDAKWFAAADEAIERALHLEPTNVEARVVKGRSVWIQGFQNRTALSVLAEALRLNPNSHDARLWQSLVFLHVGLLEEARDGLAETLARQPDDPFSINFLGQTLEFQGDYDAAEDCHARALALDPSHMYANLFLPTVLIRKNELDRAEQGIRTAEQILGEDPVLLSSQALIWSRRGDEANALALVERALGQSATLAHRHHSWHNIAAVHGMMDRPQEAVDWLRRAAAQGLPNFPLFRNDPLLRSLHGHEEFESLLEELHREWVAFRRDFGN